MCKRGFWWVVVGICVFRWPSALAQPLAPAVPPQPEAAPAAPEPVVDAGKVDAIRRAAQSRRQAELEARRAIVQERAMEDAAVRRARRRTPYSGPTPAQIAMSRFGPQWYTFGGVSVGGAYRFPYMYHPWKPRIYLTPQPVYIPVPVYYQSSGFYYSIGY